jgi:hypothetical protein
MWKNIYKYEMIMMFECMNFVVYNFFIIIKKTKVYLFE